MNAQKLAITLRLLKEKLCGDSDSDRGVKMRVPIVEIDGVKNIECYFEFYQKKKGLSFDVKADFKYDGEDDEKPIMYIKAKYNNDGLNKFDILAFSQELLHELPKLRLGISGGFGIPDNESESMRAAFEDIFTSIECETLKINKTLTCSVCYEKTHTKTPCDHALCNRCWSKIGRCGEDNNEIACPLCRENIYYV